MQPSELLSTGRAGFVPKASLVPTAFIFGVLFLVCALLLQVTTYVPPTEIATSGVALALTINADACFLYIIWRGNRVAKVFAVLCVLTALLDTFSLLWWAVMTLSR